jgi:hypothetical protein
MTGPRARLAACALALCLPACAAPAAALAQSPSQSGYGETPLVAPPRSAVAAVNGNDGSGRPVASGTGSPGASGASAAGAGAAAGPAAAADPSATLDAGSGNLPFTGMDLGVIALAAAALLAAGAGLRRVTT